jgi:hypothetical protein
MEDETHWLAPGTRAPTSEIHTLVRGGWNGAWQATLGSWDIREYGGQALWGTKLLEENRFSFEKNHI